jgi:hypothetical protein
MVGRLPEHITLGIGHGPRAHRGCSMAPTLSFGTPSFYLSRSSQVELRISFL